MKFTYKVALSGMIMALCVICMMATAIIPIGSFALPAIAGTFLVVLSLEFGRKWALLVFLGASLISIFVSADHTATFTFIFLLGHYPITKGFIEQKFGKISSWVVKILCLNFAIVLGVLATVLFFGVQYLLTEYAGFTAITTAIFILACNLIFVFFDRALTKIILAIKIKFLPLLHKLR